MIGEYLKMMGKGIKNPMKIIDGIITNTKLKLGNLPEDEVEEIIKRRVICYGCPFMSRNALEDKSQNFKTDRLDDHCIHCLCNIELKTASLESKCGLEAYNEENPNNKIPLKWHKYDKKN